MKYKALKGICDILPPETYIWQHIESVAKEVFKTYGCKEIRLPIIESSEIFIRSIGETTDIVEKEMYTFQDKAGRSVTMRPEGTAPFVRAFVEHSLHNEPSPQKYYYMGPMFRYERPQAGRQRQFHQIGIEALGTDDPKIDAEVISMLMALLKRIGLKDIELEVNSIGCGICRPEYKTVVKDFLRENLEFFCEDCKRRYEINPLRILDCKVEGCIGRRQAVPSIVNLLCDDCKDHFEELQHYLQLLNVSYRINPNLVRGLDYYTRTAFEVKGKSLGAQNAVAAGGRYGSLVEEFGGPAVSGIGFAIGVERLLSLVSEGHNDYGPDIFLCFLGDEAEKKSFMLTNELRAEGLWVETAYDKSSLRSQMRRADRIKAKNVIVMGEEELKKKKVIVKNMAGKEEVETVLEGAEIIKVVQKDILSV
ncbi:MAG: histidine--tRNA ligase [Nitrospirae bacterium]|nr:histidine--tRNA ligase [Nitrospirota bacterium]